MDSNSLDRRARHRPPHGTYLTPLHNGNDTIAAALARLPASATIPHERRHLVNRDGVAIGTVDPPHATVKIALEASRIHEQLKTSARHVVGGAAQALERVWVQDQVLPRSGTCMKRTTLNEVCVAWSNYLGVPLAHSAGNITPGGWSGLELDADAVRAWLKAAVAGEVGSLDAGDWHADLLAYPVDNISSPAPEQHELTLRVTNLELGVDCDLLLVMELGTSSPVLYDVELTGEWVRGARPSPSVACLDAVLHGIHELCRSGEWVSVNSVYIPKVPKPGTMSQWTSWLGVGHASHFAPALGKPPLEGHSEKVLVMGHDTVSGLYSGVVAAGDVDTAQMVYGGGPNSRGTSYSIMRVLVNGTRAEHVHKYPKGTARPQILAGHAKRSPCVRDGLLSPILTNALTGDGTGQVGCEFEDDDGVRHFYPVPTVWCDAVEERDGAIIRATRDPDTMHSTLLAFALLQEWRLVETRDVNELAVMNQAGKRLSVKIVYGPTAGPRWLECVGSAEVVDLAPVYDDRGREYPSELAMDYWASGFARYVFKDWIRAGRLTEAGMVTRAHSSFPRLREQDHQIRQPVVDVVINAERVQVNHRDSVAYYTYALGVAVCHAGALVMASTTVDSAFTTDDIAPSRLAPGAANAARSRITANHTRANVAAILRSLHDMAGGQATIRVYSAGAAQTESTWGRAPDGVKLLPGTARIQEIGPLLDTSRSMQTAAGWDAAEPDPGELAVLHAIQTGLAARGTRREQVRNLRVDKVAESVAELVAQLTGG